LDVAERIRRPGRPAARTAGSFLKAIASEAEAAGQIAKETGIGHGTVATTLTKLVSDGQATKATRGH
jgi:hypothetical protein